MSPDLNRLLLRLGRWPRRVAVVVCLLLAASNLLHERGGSAAAAPDPLAHLAPGQVAVPITLNQTGTDGVLRTGDRVGLLASSGSSDLDSSTRSSELIADRLLVLRVSGAPPGGDGTGSILVAADHLTALRIARSTGLALVAVVDKSP